MIGSLIPMLAHFFLASFQFIFRSVSRLMKVAKISSKIKAGFKPSTTDSKHENRISPNLLDKNFQVDKPNQNAIYTGENRFVGYKLSTISKILR